MRWQASTTASDIGGLERSLKRGVVAALAWAVVAILTTLLSPVRAADDYRAVGTPQALQAAVRDGVRLIVVTDHLNLRGLPPVADIELTAGVLHVESTVAIQGRCQALPSAESQVSTPPGTCVLTVAEDFLETATTSSDLWLSNLQVRLIPSGAPYVSAAMLLHRGGTLWLTDVILEGNGARCRGVDVVGAQTERRALYATRTTFTAFSQDHGAAVRAQPRTAVVLDQATFVSNDVVDAPVGTAALRGPALYAAAYTAVRVRSPTFAANFIDGAPANTPLSVAGTTALSGAPAFQAYNAATGGLVWSQPITTPDAALLAEGAPERFAAIREELDAVTGQTSPGLPAAVTSVVTQAPVAPQPQVLEEGEGREGEEPPPPEGGEGAAPPEDGARTGAIVGGVCALALVALGALMTALLLLRRSRTRSRTGKPPTSYGTEAPFSEVVRQTHSTLAGSSPLKSPAALSVTQLRPRSPRSRPPQGGLALTGTTNTYFSHTAAPATTTATHLHGATSTLNADVLLRGATGADGVWRRRMVASELARALDALEASGRPFLGEFELLGGERRCVGGQGVVQFARPVHGGGEVAIKFYLEEEAFATEEALFREGRLRGVMPAVTLISANADREQAARNGLLYPPCIVAERGEALDDWARRHQPDFPTVLQILSHVAARMAQLHAQGYAHRDLKPANVLWRPAHHSWTLLDFGCAARIGEDARLAFSLLYAPPETVHAFRANAHTVPAAAAVDVWALGVMAFELLTDAPAFPRESSTFETVCAQLAGEAALPWERAPGVFAPPPTLRMLSDSVCACLRRDAARRPTAAELLDMWSRLFDRPPASRPFE